MRGTITGRDVVLHPIVIIRRWGFGAYARCLRAAIARDGTTFLDVICAVGR